MGTKYVSRSNAYNAASKEVARDGNLLRGCVTLSIISATSDHHEVTVQARTVENVALGCPVEYTVFFDVSLNDYRAVRR